MSEVRCEGCGSPLTDAEIEERRRAGAMLSCCPERKPVSVDQWRARALEAESRLADLTRLVDEIERGFRQVTAAMFRARMDRSAGN